MATISRSSSGLVVYDDFSTDTSANYDPHNASTISVSSGTLRTSGDFTVVVRTGANSANCVTVYVTSSNSASSGPMLLANSSLGSANDVDGYWMRPAQSSASRLNRDDNMGATQLGTTGSGFSGSVYSRVYRSGTSIVGKAGTSALSASITASDSTYSSTMYGGFCFRYTTELLEWIEIRTAHTVTVTGLPTGYYAKVTDGTTTAKAAESSGTATVDAGAVLFPLSRVSVYNGDPDGAGVEVDYIASTTLTDMGGGDSFAYSSGIGKLAWWLGA